MFSMFSAKTSDVFTFYVAWGCEKAMLNPIWPVRLKRISRNAIWIGFQATYKCSSKRICTNRISCSSLPFRLFKYDRISIGFAQKSDLGWQSERGFCSAVRGYWQSSESFNFMQMNSNFQERQPIGKKTVELMWLFSSLAIDKHTQWKKVGSVSHSFFFVCTDLI